MKIFACTVVLLFVVSVLISCSEASTRQKRNHYGNPSYISTQHPWVWYHFDHYVAPLNENEKQIIKNAMADIESVSCIRFKEASDEEERIHKQVHLGHTADYHLHKHITTIKKNYTSGHCAVTHHGRNINGIQFTWAIQVEYGHRCFRSYHNIMHELMHMLGFLHEHQRKDAKENIRFGPNQRINATWSQKKADLQIHNSMQPGTANTAYDPCSVMHYKYRWMDIQLLKYKGRTFDYELGFSKLDVYRMNKNFNCSNYEEPEPKPCEMVPFKFSPLVQPEPEPQTTLQPERKCENRPESTCDKPCISRGARYNYFLCRKKCNKCY